MEQHIVGVLLGAGSVAVGYFFSKVAVWFQNEADYLRHAPRYHNFADLERDLANGTTSGFQSRILVEGIVSKDKTVLFSDKGGIDGAAKLVISTSLRKVLDEESGKWEEKRDTFTNQCLSVPFKLVDRKGSSLTVENVHLASGFRRILQLVYQSKDVPEQRSIGDYATGLTLSEISAGSEMKEYMLLYGATFAGFGDAMQFGIDGSTSRIIFYPTEVGHSIKSMISEREFMVGFNQVLSKLFTVGGLALIFVASIHLVLKLSRKWRQDRDRHLLSVNSN